MKKWLLFLLLPAYGCTSYQYSNKFKGEEITIQSLEYTEPLTLKSVVDMNNPGESSRGVISTDMLLQGANLAIQGVKYLIDESKKKYIAEYTAALHNENFYAGNSKLGMLDPEGIQFKGFVFKRQFKEKEGIPLNAITLYFSIDENKAEDIYFNSRFYLKLDSAHIDYAKVKLNDKKWYLPWTWFIKKQTTFNMDVDISVLANWIDQSGSIHADIPFGRFILPLRKIPVNPDDATRLNFFNNLKGMEVAGSSYLIPRSVTYCTDKRGKSEPCYGRGNFNLNVKIQESSKEGFVTKIIHDNSEEWLKNINVNDLKKVLK